VTALRHPASVYLDQLDATSRPCVRSRLDIAASILRPGTDATTFPWSTLTINETKALRATLAERYAWTTVNAYLSSLRGVLRAAWLTGQMTTDAHHRAISVPKLRGKVIPSGRHISAEEFHHLFTRLAQDSSNKARRDLASLRGRSVYKRKAGGASESPATRREPGGADRKNRQREGQPLSPDWHGRMVPFRSPRMVERSRYYRRRLVLASTAGGSIPKDLRHLTNAGMDNVLKRRLREYDLPPFTWHDFRRTVAGDLLDQNADIEAIQSQLGHASASQTIASSRRPLRQLRKVAQQVPSPFGGGAE
jgi:integrase